MSTAKRRSNGLVVLGSLVSALWLMSATASANPVLLASVDEFQLDVDLFQYDYTVTNDSDPLSGFNLFDMFFDFGDDVAIFNATAPFPWTFEPSVSTPPAPQFILFFSSDPSDDLLPSSSFIFDIQTVGQVPIERRLDFLGSFTNPGDPDNPFVVTPVPEPATLLLLGVGVCGLAVRRRRSSEDTLT